MSGLLSLACLFVARAESSLVLELRDGTTHSYVLSEQPRVSFADGSLVMTATGAETRYAISEVENFHFADVSALPVVSAEAWRVRCVGGVLTVEGYIGEVVVTDVSGRIVYQGKAGSIDLGQQPRGTYLVRVGRQMVKLFN